MVHPGDKTTDCTALESSDLPRAISESVMKIGDFEMRCYVLEDGRRIFNADDVHRFFGEILAAGVL